MAAPLALRVVKQFLFLKPVNSFLLAKNSIERRSRDGWHCLRSLPLVTEHLAHLQHRLYSQSPPNSGKPPLKKPYTPVGKHDSPSEKHRDAEKEPLEAFPDDINPVTGERGGPRGPEPTRYGDWERKGRCIDF
ncbi:succinate dehydrogenase assembly factor 4, mitochondrial-like [Acanthaster planci]|uniref:Succinate dehydrogenase assembly factor 4, mitochondrial n=1 Tax=Acanthaster planci TaxID=133434 RepID=A0A8B8A299_ACAPL|nr:succinate dehydrogenase assembly factor 4, mitochondrial-like [Acanthaster planci]